MRYLVWLQKNLSYSIPLFMLAGLAFGALADASFLRTLIIPITFVMVYPMMVTLNVKSVFSGGDTRLQLATQAVNFILMPLVVFGLGKLFFSGADPRFGLWAVGLFLLGVLPASGMTVSWTGFARGNKEAATKMLVFGLTIGALVAPVYTKLFMGAVVEVDMLHMFRQIALFVLVPLALGIATQFALRRRFGDKAWMKRFKPKFPPFSAVGVNLIAFTAMALKARGILAHPQDLLYILAPLVLFYLLSYVLLTIIGRTFFSRADGIAMVFGVVMRDLSIALAIAMTAFGKQGADIALLISLAYIIQIQSAALYVRLADRLFGEAIANKPAQSTS